MAENISEILTGSQSVSRIIYYADLQRASGRAIPLGVMAELVIGNWRALGLIARTNLGGEETTLIGRMLRESLSKPFDFLAKEFDWAVSDTSPGGALEALADRFAGSLRFVPPTVSQWRKALPRGDAAERPILNYLRRLRDDEFDLMVAESDGALGVRGEDERATLRPAA